MLGPVWHIPNGKLAPSSDYSSLMVEGRVADADRRVRNIMPDIVSGCFTLLRDLNLDVFFFIDCNS